MKVVPLPSERCTTTTSIAGSFTPELRMAFRGSFHLVILPMKMPAITTGDTRSSFVTPGRLYVRTTAPIPVGTCSADPPFAAASSASDIGASVPPKSTVIS